MKKSTTLLILILGLLLTACGSASPSGNFTNSAAQPSGTQNGSSTGLSPALQVAIGTLKLDKTTNEITAKQAADLLPLWETLQVLESSETAATQEKEALVAQIQETMTKDQMQTIAEMGLTRQDMVALLQAQGQTFALNAGQNGNGSSSSSTTRRNFGNGGGGGFFVGGGGPPPDGGGFGGGNFQGQGNRTQSTNNGTTTNGNRRQFATDPNRIPTPLIQAVIEYLKKKAGPSYP